MSTQPQRAFTAGEVLSASWGSVKKFWKDYLVIFGIVLLAYIGYALVFGVLTAAGAPEWVSQIVSTLLGVYVSIFAIRGALVIGRGQKLDLSKLIKINAKTFLHALLATLLLTVVVVLGLVFLIVPGIILGLMFGYSLYSVVDAETDVITSFKDSMQLTRSNKWQIFAYHVLLCLIGLAVLVLPLIVIFGVLSQTGNFSLSALGPMVILGILVLLFMLVIGVMISMVNMAGQAYMYLKMREHSAAPKA